MTFEQFAYGYLYNNGMFPDDAKKVVEAAKNDEILKDTMQGGWDDDMAGYPPFMENIFIVSLNSVAVKYIDENMPKAWFRQIFAG